MKGNSEESAFNSSNTDDMDQMNAFINRPPHLRYSLVFSHVIAITKQTKIVPTPSVLRAFSGSKRIWQWYFLFVHLTTHLLLLRCNPAAESQALPYYAMRTAIFEDGPQIRVVTPEKDRTRNASSTPAEADSHTAKDNPTHTDSPHSIYLRIVSGQDIIA